MIHTLAKGCFMRLLHSSHHASQHIIVDPLTPSLTLYQRLILDYSKLKEFADDNFKFNKNGRKLSKWVENTMGKGEIARYEQFLLFPQCFQKACFPGASKGVIVREWVMEPSHHDVLVKVL